jgi:hypothetical protein
LDTAQPHDAEAALADANAAWGMLPDNPLVLSARIYAHVVAAGIYQEAKQIDRGKAAVRDASRDAQALEPLLETCGVPWSLWVHYGSRQ